MRTALISLAVVLASLAPAQTGGAPESAAVMAVVNGFVDAFNKGDTRAAASVCAAQTSIIDEFPPHEWHGAGACAKWMNDYDFDAKKNGITGGLVTLGKARHVDVANGLAYVVVPTDYVYQMHGKPVKESGSTLTVALRKQAGSWRIAGWSWSKN